MERLSTLTSVLGTPDGMVAEWRVSPPSTWHGSSLEVGGNVEAPSMSTTERSRHFTAVTSQHSEAHIPSPTVTLDESRPRASQSFFPSTAPVVQADADTQMALSATPDRFVPAHAVHPSGSAIDDVRTPVHPNRSIPCTTYLFLITLNSSK